MRVEVLECTLSAGREPRLFVKLRLPFGLILHDIKVAFASGQPRVTLPVRPVFRADTPVRDASGAQVFRPMLTFDTYGERMAFDATVLAAVQASHPDLLAKVQPPSFTQDAGVRRMERA